MKRSAFVMTLLLSASGTVLADPVTAAFGGHIGYVGNEGPSGSDFDGSGTIEGMGQLVFNPIVALEAGFTYSSKTEDSNEDNQGQYTVGVTNTDLFAGVRLDSRRFGPVSIYGRGGFLRYFSTVKLEESFYGLKSAGSVEKDEEGFGYYLGSGVAFHLGPHLKLDVGLDYRMRSDYFKDSSKPFDMTQFGLSTGLLFVLP